MFSVAQISLVFVVVVSIIPPVYGMSSLEDLKASFDALKISVDAIRGNSSVDLALVSMKQDQILAQQSQILAQQGEMSVKQDKTLVLQELMNVKQDQLMVFANSTLSTFKAWTDSSLKYKFNWVITVQCATLAFVMLLNVGYKSILGWLLLKCSCAISILAHLAARNVLEKLVAVVSPVVEFLTRLAGIDCASADLIRLGVACTMYIVCSFVWTPLFFYIGCRADKRADKKALAEMAEKVTQMEKEREFEKQQKITDKAPVTDTTMAVYRPFNGMYPKPFP